METREHQQTSTERPPKVLELGDGTRLVFKGEEGTPPGHRPSNEILDLSRALDIGGAPFGGYVRAAAAKIS